MDKRLAWVGEADMIAPVEVRLDELSELGVDGSGGCLKVEI